MSIREWYNNSKEYYAIKGGAWACYCMVDE